ncbi:MAG: hypothetical protein RJA63_1085 [Pseudomonadota bacterium]|jgi:1-acyl-sn-glycerol-3-phosphate acyltransferase
MMRTPSRRSQRGFLLIPALLPLFPAAREIRAAWRLARLALLLLKGFLILRLLFPHWSSAKRRLVKQAWSRQLAQVLGVRLPAECLDLPPGALIVSNHVSWLDIYVINAVTETHFVCKDEVRDWPLIGWLVEHAETVFIARGSRTAAARTARTIAARLAAGERVAVFPEGTTSSGTVLLPFRSALFQAAVEADVPVLPVALRYRDAQGKPSSAPAYAGDTTFWDCLRAITLSTGLRAELEFLPPLPAGLDRRELASRAEHDLACALGLSIGSASADTSTSSTHSPEASAADGLAS